MKYQVTNNTERSIVVDGLGVIGPGLFRMFTQDDANRFEETRGLKLPLVGLPEGVELTVIVEEE